MKNPLIAYIENKQLKKEVPIFRTGDTVAVSIKIKEGDRERLQLFEGTVIARRRKGAAFTVRKITHGVGVERVFQTQSPLIEHIKVIRKGDVRKSKLYYLRKLEGRKMRIQEKLAFKKEIVPTPES